METVGNILWGVLMVVLWIVGITISFLIACIPVVFVLWLFGVI